MLPPASRIRSPEGFRATARQGVRVGRRCVVVHVRRRPEPPSRAGFVVSKAVGGAVIRNRVKRRLRHLCAGELEVVPFPVDVVVRALPAAVRGDLAGDFRGALRAGVRRLTA